MILCKNTVLVKWYLRLRGGVVGVLWTSCFKTEMCNILEFKKQPENDAIHHVVWKDFIEGFFVYFCSHCGLRFRISSCPVCIAWCFISHKPFVLLYIALVRTYCIIIRERITSTNKFWNHSRNQIQFLKFDSVFSQHGSVILGLRLSNYQKSFLWLKGAEKKVSERGRLESDMKLGWQEESS